MKLVKSHRTFGYEVARVPDPERDGRELVIVRTSDSPVGGLDVVPAHTLMDVLADEVALRLQVELQQAIARARFFGLQPERIEALVQAAAQEIAVQEP